MNVARHSKRLLAALVASTITVVDVHAAVTDIYSQPLATTSTVVAKPNVMFILDNSGSMASDYMPDDMSDNSKYGFKSTRCNGLAFDPSYAYTPPVYSDGTPYSNANFNAAAPDGYVGIVSRSSGSSITVGTGSRTAYIPSAASGDYSVGDSVVITSAGDPATWMSGTVTGWNALGSKNLVVDVTGTSKGKGFQGVMKRYNFAGGRATHGNSLSHRIPGSTGQRQDPGKVFKGKKMAGHMGDVRVTTQNLKIVKTDVPRGLIMVEGAVPGAKGERIAKLLARAGLCSRRDAERWIAAGRVSIDGVVLTSPAINVTPGMAVALDGKPIPLKEPPRLWRYYKPRGQVTTARDPRGRPTVFDALPKDMPRVISVGRLDLNSEGLLLLTNDGELARRLELPSGGWVRRYRVRVRGAVDPQVLRGLAKGITIDEMNYGPVRAALDRQQGSNAWLSFALTEGKNREIRRICEAGIVVHGGVVRWYPRVDDAIEAYQVMAIERQKRKAALHD